MNHFDEVTCLLYIDGQLERSRALELSSHAEACAECRALLRALDRESKFLAQSLTEADESVPARLTAPPGREATRWAWIVSFGLAAAALYALWTGVIEPFYNQFDQVGLGERNIFMVMIFEGALWKGWGEMQNVIQGLAMAALGVLAIYLLRRTWRRGATLAVVVSALFASLALPAPAGAAEIIHNKRNYTLSAGETINNDLVVMARTARIDGNVSGDLIFCGQSLTINGTVSGDVISFSESVRINGPVQGNVRSFSKMLSLSDTVAKNVTAFTQILEFDSKSEATGMMIFVAEANLSGRIRRDLMAFSKNVLLNGFIGGSALVRAEHLTIADTAQIDGKASYRGPHQPEVSPQAKLASPLEINIVKKRPNYYSARFYIHQALRWGAGFVLGLILIGLLPGFFTNAMHSTRNFGLSLGIGALSGLAWAILLVISCALLFIGVLGGLATTLVFLPIAYLGHIFVGAWVGELLMGRAASTQGAIARLAVGLLAIRVLGMVPYVGGLVWLVVFLAGAGAILHAIYTRNRALAATAPAAA